MELVREATENRERSQEDLGSDEVQPQPDPIGSLAQRAPQSYPTLKALNPTVSHWLLQADPRGDR